MVEWKIHDQNKSMILLSFEYAGAEHAHTNAKKY